MAYIKQHGPHHSGGSRQRRPRLLVALAAWAFLASILCLQRWGSAVSDCQHPEAAGQEPAAGGPVDAAVAAAVAARDKSQLAEALQEPQLPPEEQQKQQGGQQQGEQQQPPADERWPSLRGLSRDAIEQLIRAPVGLHGRVEKGGLPANYMFVLAHLTDTDPRTREEGIPRIHGPAVYSWFAHAFMFNKSAGHSNYNLQSPVPACHFWADHKYKLLYVRNFKTAGTSISITLGQKELPMYCTIWPDTCAKKCTGKQVCLENIVDPERLKQLFQQYTVFSFVRNPWARALSSWHHVHKLGINPECQGSFEKWSELPSRYGAKCLGIRNCCKRRFGWLLEHTEPQTTCLFDQEGRPAVDFLGRVEHLDEDMQELVRLVNSRLDPEVEPLRVGALPHWQLARQDMKDREDEKWRYYSEFYHNSSTALQDVRSYFHHDFDLLQMGMPP